MKASDVQGGEITWNCLGSGEIVAQLSLYVNCDSGKGMAPDTVYLKSNIPGFDSIMVWRFDTVSISPTCYSPTSTVVCGQTPQVEFAMSKYKYKSAALSLTSAPSIGGWYLEYQECCRASDNFMNSSASLYLRTVIYPYLENGSIQSFYPCYDVSPQFEERPQLYFGVGEENYLIVTDVSDGNADSVFVEWTEAKDSIPFPGTSIAYHSDYSFDQPLPDSNVAQGSIWTDLDPKTGKLHFKSNKTGVFSTAVKLSSFRGQQLISEVYRDVPFMVVNNPINPGLCNVTANNVPKIEVDSIWPGTSHVVKEVKDKYGDLIYYYVDGFVGDKLQVKFTASDIDFNPDCLSQKISFSASGAGLSQEPDYSASSNCFVDGNCATFKSLNIGGYFTSTLNNQVAFIWDLDSVHDVNNGLSKYLFKIRFTDNHCRIPGVSEVLLEVRVRRPVKLSSHHEEICRGSAVQVFVERDTTNLLWSPSSGVSNVNSAAPIFNPTKTTVYTLTDQNSGYQEHLEIVVDSIEATTIARNGSQFEMSNAVNYDSLIWRVNGAVYETGTTSISPNLTGTYFLHSTHGVCDTMSNTLDTTLSMSVPLSNYAFISSHREHHPSASYGLNMENYGFQDLEINGIRLTALKQNDIDSARFILEIMDETQASLKIADSVSIIDDYSVMIHLDFTFEQGEAYFISLFSNGQRVIELFAPSKWPVITSVGNVYVFNASREPGYVRRPSITATDYPYLHFAMDKPVSVEELTLRQEWYAYPNPTSGILTLSKEGEFELYDLMGRKLIEFKGQSLDLTPYESGIYFVHEKEGGIVRVIKN